MKSYRRGFKRYHFGYVVLLAALLYSVWLCLSGIHTALSQQAEQHLTAQIQEAMVAAFDTEEPRNFVHLRRDADNHIIAITVNGVLLSQLQMKYLQTLETEPSVWQIELPIFSILGGKLLSWIPGKISLSCQPVIDWDVSVLSRTIESNHSTNQFQLVLVTNGTADGCLHLLNTEIHKEIILYETVIYGSDG